MKVLENHTGRLQYIKECVEILTKGQDPYDILRDPYLLVDLPKSPIFKKFFSGVKLAETSYLPYTGLSGETTIPIRVYRNKRDLTLEDAVKTYEEIFWLMSDALVEAYKAGKRLSVHIGEFHTDRGSSFVNIAAANVASRLGITKIGIEAAEKEQIIILYDESGRETTVPALNEYPEFRKNLANPDGSLPETHKSSPQPDGRIMNKVALIPHLFANPKNTVFSTDHGNPGLRPSVKTMYDKREIEMLKKLHHHAQGDHTIHFTGALHLFGLDKREKRYYAKTTYPLTISAQQFVYAWPASSFSLNDPYEWERAIMPNTDKIVLEGYVPTIDKAKELANAADAKVGEKLAEKFFLKHPELDPQKPKTAPEKLEGMVPGGRTPTQRKQVHL